MTGGQPNSTPAADAELGSHGSADRAPDRSVDSQDTDKALLAPATRSSALIMTSDQAASGGSGEIPPSPLPPSPLRSSSSLSVTAGSGISMDVTTWITSRRRMESANQPMACSVSPRRSASLAWSSCASANRANQQRQRAWTTERSSSAGWESAMRSLSC